jgi:hypothetical protein
VLLLSDAYKDTPGIKRKWGVSSEGLFFGPQADFWRPVTHKSPSPLTLAVFRPLTKDEWGDFAWHNEWRDTMRTDRVTLRVTYEWIPVSILPLFRWPLIEPLTKAVFCTTTDFPLVNPNLRSSPVPTDQTKCECNYHKDSRLKKN